jgi:hypothetical protein
MDVGRNRKKGRLGSDPGILRSWRDLHRYGAIQNAKAAYLTLTAEEIKFIDDELKQLRLVGKGVPIS